MGSRYLVCVRGCELHYPEAVANVLLDGHIQNVIGENGRVVVDVLQRDLHLWKSAQSPLKPGSGSIRHRNIRLIIIITVRGRHISKTRLPPELLETEPYTN